MNFHPLLTQWFTEKYKHPVGVQSDAWKEAEKSGHVLVTAPTGSGKTLAAFFSGIDRLICKKWPCDTTSILYISPLKALNSDIRCNLVQPLSEIRELFQHENTDFPPITVKTRSGDTPQKERYEIFAHPPSIFITTPETLLLLLSQEKGIKLLSSVKCVILDEIHSIAGNRRGSILSACMERLCSVAGSFQRIGLSATVNPVERIKLFLGGYEDDRVGISPRKVTHITSTRRKETSIAIEPVQAPFGIFGDEYWRAVSSRIKQLVSENRSTLIFVNSRKMSEIISRFLNEGKDYPLAYAHHGSLSKSLRLNVEDQLRKGALKAIVATNSLELGIDIGFIDLVVFVQPPFTVSSFIQKLGRAGHSVGAVSKAVCIPVNDLDTCHFRGYIDALDKGQLEEIRIPESPLDVLAQLVISKSLTGRYNAKEYFSVLTKSHAFHNLDMESYLSTVRFLSGFYKGLPVKDIQKRIFFDEETGTITAHDSARLAFFSSSGTIPDRGYFSMRTSDNRIIGELDEEFVWERKVGDVFVFGNSKWKVQAIDNNNVTVMPYSGTENSTIFWKAEEVISPGLCYQKMREILEEDLSGNSAPADNPLSRSLFSRGIIISSDTVYLEYVKDCNSSETAYYIFIHTFSGGEINKALHFAIRGFFDQQGIQAHVFSNNRLVAIISFEETDFSLKDICAGFTSFLYKAVENSGFFGARFREIANRFLVLPSTGFNKRVPLWLNRARTKQFYQKTRSYRDNPVTKETWHEVISNVLDMEATAQFLDSVRTGMIREKKIVSATPSLLCDDAVFRLTDGLMYTDDQPLADSRTSISMKYFLKLVHNSGIDIDPAYLRVFDNTLKSLTPEYAPDSESSVREYLEERIIVPFSEWDILCSLVITEEETRMSYTDIFRLESPYISGVCGKSGLEILCGIFPELETAMEILDLEGHQLSAIKIKPRDDIPDEVFFLKYLLSFYGPVTMETLCDLFGFSRYWLDQWLKVMLSIESESVLYDVLLKGIEDKYILLVENLEKLLSFRKLPKTVFSCTAFDFQRHILSFFHMQKEPYAKIRSLLEYPVKITDLLSRLLPLRFDGQEMHELEALLHERTIIPVVQGDAVIFTDTGRKERIIEEKPDSKILPLYGSCTFPELKEKTGLRWPELFTLVRNELKKGIISCDSLESINQILSKKSSSFSIDERLSFHDWKQKRLLPGHWFYVPHFIENQKNSIEALEEEKDRVRLLLSRYGIICREILAAERTGYTISAVRGALRLMELSGEIQSGYFIEGIHSRQYTSPGFISSFKNRSNDTTSFVVYYREPLHILKRLNAYPVDGPLITSSPYYMVIDRENPPLFWFFTKKQLDGFTESRVSALHSLLSSGSDTSIIIEKVNGKPVRESGYLDVLEKAGGISGRHGLRFDLYTRVTR